MLNQLQCFQLILTLIYEISAYRYLVVSPTPGKSHAILGEALVETIANAGHEVTFITSFLPEKVPQRVTVVDTSENIKLFPSDATMKISKILDKTNKLDVISVMTNMMDISQATIANSNVQKLLMDENQKFDAVIVEWMFNEVYAGFSGVFNCPLIWFSSVEPHWAILQLVDEVPNPAYTVNMLSDSVPPLTFYQRVFEFVFQMFGRLGKYFVISLIENNLYEEYFVPAIRKRERLVPSFKTLQYNASLILANSHVSIGIAAKLPPNVINIGGYHIKPNVKPLTKDLKQLLDNAKHGVIYFSMGSNLKSGQFPAKVKQELLEMFRKFEQTVIWKFEENLINAPANVHIVEWAPQQSILAHKNCVLFITHGGLLSVMETIHFGVPIIGVPAFGDQFINIARAVKKGFARKVNLSYSFAPDLETAIRKILGSSKYITRVKELSQVYHDRPVPPAQELVHWVEHVVKTRGATHLRSPAFLVPWYQKLYLDLLFLLLVSIVALKYVFIYLGNTLLTKRKEKYT